KEQILEIIKEIMKLESDGFMYKYHDYIVTNDKDLLMKYIFVLNLSDFIMLCGTGDFQYEQIRINPQFFRKFNREVLYYFSKIKDEEIISANQEWSCTTIEHTYLGNGKFHTSENKLRGELIEEYEG